MNTIYIWRLELFFKNMADINPAFIMPQNNVIITFIRSRRLILNFELSYILILFFSLVLDWFQNQWSSKHFTNRHMIMTNISPD